MVLQAPALSIYELTELFDDHPTAALIGAICEQLPPRKQVTNRDLLAAMYPRLPVTGALPKWFEGRLTDEQAGLIDEGFYAWKQTRKDTT